MSICVHTLIKNEERYLWYSIMSIIKHVDRIMLWDTGSIDKSKEIGRYLSRKYPSIIDYKEVRQNNIEDFTLMRQQMLSETKENWVFIVDGDEVWWDESAFQITTLMRVNKLNLETIVNRYMNVIGDMFHYQEEKAGRYSIDGITGHITVRAMNMRIPGFHIANPHGKQAFYDSSKTPVQERDKNQRIFLEGMGYMHFTHMRRSSNLQNDLFVPKRDIKQKFELGHSFPLDFYYPEAFFLPRPSFVPNVWYKMTKNYRNRAFIETPMRKLKRRLVKGKSGY